MAWQVNNTKYIANADVYSIDVVLHQGQRNLYSSDVCQTVLASCAIVYSSFYPIYTNMALL